MGIKAVPESNIIMDVPIVLNSVSFQDDYDGDFQTRRFVTYTMNFTLKAWMFGPVQNQGIINRAIIDIEGMSAIQLDGDPSTGGITFILDEDLLPWSVFVRNGHAAGILFYLDGSQFVNRAPDLYFNN